LTELLHGKKEDAMMRSENKEGNHPTTETRFLAEHAKPSKYSLFLGFAPLSLLSLSHFHPHQTRALVVQHGVQSR
jgi:hypothetical protein